MCGLAGALRSGGSVDKDVVRRMNEAIAHRGPDDFGVWSDADAGITVGHRRLAIVDLSAAGHQPMMSVSGRFVLAFNGEIYNHLDIRVELERAGHAPAWRGHSDTETLLAGISAWGLEATLARCNGMFAIALWDRETRELQLARDRLGEKPLYFGWQGTGGAAVFLFGSELKALRVHPSFRAPVNRGAVSLFLQHNYIPSPWSIYDGISKLQPATILTVSRSAPIPTLRKYWDFATVAAAGARAPFEGTAIEAVDELERRCSAVIARQMVADVPLGAFLSGGVDSSVVVALMQAQSERRVRTFTIGFDQAEFNEAAHAKRVAEHLGTDHTELYVTAQQARDVIPLLPAMYCEPFADSSQIPTYLVSQLARRHVTVSLSGDAGDELFAGYTRYFRAADRWRALQRVPAGVRRFGSAMTAVLAGPLARSGTHDWAMRLARAAPVLGSQSLEALYRQDIAHVRRPEAWVLDSAALATAFTECDDPRLDSLHRMMALDTVTYLPDDVLAKVDRAAMAVSLETRVPFLDHELVEFAWRLPAALKTQDGRGKWPLREILYRHVPRALVDRPKMGFGVPVAEWLRGPLREWAEGLLGADLLREQGFLNAALVRGTWRQHLASQADWSFQLWNVLMFQAWLQAESAR